jgi:hypothetical protein
MADVTFTVTGLSSTSNLGDLTYSGASEGWGRFSWGRADWGDTNLVVQGWGRDTWGFQSWGDTPIVSLTGLSATTSIGSVDTEIRPGWGTLTWGQNGWGSIESATESLTGFSLTSSLGTVVAEDVVGLSGFRLTSTLNSLSAVFTDATITLTGQSLISSHGLLSVDDHSVGLQGQSATSSVGSLTPADVIGLTGLSADTDLGTLAFSSNPIVNLSALTVLAAQLGGITATPETIATPAGQSSTTSLGTVTTVQVSNAFPEGQIATTGLNDSKLILRYYGKISPKNSTGYTDKTPKTSVSGYSIKTPKNTTGYTTLTS